MGSKTSLLLQEEEIEAIQRETNFSTQQIIRLYSRFLSLDKSENGALSPSDLLRIPELAINPLGPRIVEAFFADCRPEEEKKINFKQFVKILAIFRPTKDDETDGDAVNSREQKLRFAFKMYDLDNNDTVSQEELFTLLQMLVGSNITPDQLNSIAQRTIAEADDDNDGEISFEDFKKALSKVDADHVMSIRFLD